MLIPLCWLFPFTGDDWAWGSQIGIDRFRALFDGYNGRYVGNLLVLLFTRHRLLRAITMSMTYTVIVNCISFIAHSKYTFLTACLLLGLTPKLVFRQAVVWTSGYSNYVTSAALVLLLLAFSVDKSNNIYRHKNLYSFGMLILGFTNALIVEHITLYEVAFGIVLLIYAGYYNKEKIKPFAFFLAGAITGAILMFSNSAYHTIAEGNEGYRTFADGGVLRRVLENYYTSIYNDGFFSNIILNILFLIIAANVYIYIKEKKLLAPKQKFLLKATLLLYAISLTYNVLAKTLFIYIETPNEVIILNGVVALLELCFLIMFSLIAAKSFDDLYRVSIVILSIIMIMAPLFLVTPIGPRCFFCTYLLFILLLCILVEYLGDENASKIIQSILKTCCISILIFYIGVFSTIEVANNRRLEIIRQAEASHKSTVEFVNLPFNSFLWTSAPEGELWEERYKLFYDISEKIHIVVKEREITE